MSWKGSAEGNRKGPHRRMRKLEAAGYNCARAGRQRARRFFHTAAEKPRHAKTAPEASDKSAILELGRAFFDESRHSLFLILRGEKRLESAPLEKQPFGQARFGDAIDRLFR